MAHKKTGKRSIAVRAVAVIGAVVLLLAIGWSTNWLGYYGPTTKIMLAAKKTLDKSSFTAQIQLTVGQFDPDPYTLAFSIDPGHRELIMTLADSNGTLQCAIYDGFWIQRTGSLGRYQATDISHHLDALFDHAQDLDLEELLRAIDEELYLQAREAVDFQKATEYLPALYRQWNQPKFLKEALGMTKEKENGVSCYRFRPDTRQVLTASLACFEEAFLDPDRYEDAVQALEQEGSDHQTQICFLLSKGYLTGLDIQTQIQERAVKICLRLDQIGSTAIDTAALEDILDRCR